MLDLLCDLQSVPNPSGPLSSPLSAVGLHHLITDHGWFILHLLKSATKGLVFSSDGLGVEI